MCIPFLPSPCPQLLLLDVSTIFILVQYHVYPSALSNQIQPSKINSSLSKKAAFSSSKSTDSTVYIWKTPWFIAGYRKRIARCPQPPPSAWSFRPCLGGRGKKLNPHHKATEKTHFNPLENILIGNPKKNRTWMKLVKSNPKTVILIEPFLPLFRDFPLAIPNTAMGNGKSPYR